jgi:low affinity Fe/Cu permease
MVGVLNNWSLQMNEFFRKFASRMSVVVGSSWTFMLAVLLIVGWAAAGPMCHYSENWQLVINTSTTIITFLMVFLIQNAQNRDAKGLHLKLDELIKATKGARNKMIDLDSLTDEQLKDLEEDYKRICKAPDHPEQKRATAAAARAVHEELVERETEPVA